MSMPGQPGMVDADAHVEIVRGFTRPEEAWESMAFLNSHEDLTWAIYICRFAGREKRNLHRKHIAMTAGLFSRSIDGRGSHQAAGVATTRIAPPRGPLDGFLNIHTTPPSSPPDAQTNGGRKRW